MQKCPAGLIPPRKIDAFSLSSEEEIKRMKEDRTICPSNQVVEGRNTDEHDDMAKRKDRATKKDRDFCKEEEEDGTVVFPSIDVPNEIEDIEDTTCIDMNRDELLKAFCSFRHDLDNLFKIQGKTETAESFFPNICCKERRDTKLEVCHDPSGKIPREDIIPFALSQGGHYSRHNLYAEVSDALKNGGYLHKGMLGILKGVPRSKARAIAKPK